MASTFIQIVSRQGLVKRGFSAPAIPVSITPVHQDVAIRGVQCFMGLMCRPMFTMRLMLEPERRVTISFCSTGMGVWGVGSCTCSS